MAITVNYQPSFETVGRAAFDVGRGKYNQMQDEIARQQAQLNIENQFRQAQLMQQERRMNYGMYADQQNRMDRRNELQFSREAQLDDRNFRVAMDDRNFGQQQQLQQAGFQQQEEMLNLRAKMEAEAQEAERLRKQQELNDAITWDHTPQDKIKLQQFEQFEKQINSDNRYGAAERAAIMAAKRAQMNIGEKVPVNQEALREINSRMLPQNSPDDPRVYVKPNGELDIHPADKMKIENRKLEQQIINQDRDDQRALQHNADMGWQKIESGHATAVMNHEKARTQAIDTARKLALARYEAVEKANKLSEKPVDNPFPDIDAIETQAAANFDKNRPAPTPPNREEYYQRMLPQQGRPPVVPQQEMPQAPVAPQLPQPQQQAPPPPVPQPPVLAAPAEQDRQFVMPDNHPAAPAYKAVRAMVPLGKGDVVNEDALAQDFQVVSLKEGPKGVERMKTELSRASQLIMAVDEGGRKLSTPQELEEFRIAARLLMKYVKSIPRNQR